MSNRLSLEDSPYLQHYKDNPFDWYPWCDEAFEKAKIENKPIFVFIGYSRCHWCHIMERDVFENEEIASFMNEYFVCINVDREERPDLGKYFQELHSLLNRRNGGWPLSIFCTPQNKPFYAGTYIPPYNRDQMIGFSELTSIIATKISENDEKLFQNAEEIIHYLQPKPAPTQATVLDLNVASIFVKQAQHNFDSENGGFSTSPKFPRVSTLDTLMYIDRLTSDDSIRYMLTKTLDKMALGGMYDHVDNGFYRYSKDSSWLAPHFEKMAYDNALLCSLYANASLTYQNEAYSNIAKEIADFMNRCMMDNNLFYSAIDAASKSEEGRYFIYTYDEIIRALKESGIVDSDLHSAAESVSASVDGNFEKFNIIRLHSHEKPLWFETFKASLQSLRSQRRYPFLDKKILTAWNAMMIKALFVLGKIDNSYKTAAIDSLNALILMMADDDTIYHSGVVGKKPKVEGFLEDYAYMCSALLEAYESTMDESYLIRAQQFANKALETYYNRGRWTFSCRDFITIADLDDSTYPSALSVMVESLLLLGSLVDSKYRHFAFKTLEYHSYDLMKKPIYYPNMIKQIIRYLREPHTV